MLIEFEPRAGFNTWGGRIDPSPSGLRAGDPIYLPRLGGDNQVWDLIVRRAWVMVPPDDQRDDQPYNYGWYTLFAGSNLVRFNPREEGGFITLDLPVPNGTTVLIDCYLR